MILVEVYDTVFSTTQIDVCLVTPPNHVCSCTPQGDSQTTTICICPIWWLLLKKRCKKNKCIPSAREKITVDQNPYSSANSPISGTISSTPTNKTIHGYLGCPEKWLYSSSLALKRMVSTAGHMHWSAFLVLTLTTNKSAAQRQPDQHILTAIKHPMGEKRIWCTFWRSPDTLVWKTALVVAETRKMFHQEHTATNEKENQA